MRIEKNKYYLNIAKAVALRSCCIRRKIGAIIVVNDVIVSTGYNGPARGVIHCYEVGCLKDLKELPSYGGYDYCIAVHAEENAVVNAARHGSKILGGTLYLYAIDDKGNTLDVYPCKRCRRILINAGIEKVVSLKNGEIVTYNVKDWVKEDSEEYKKNVEMTKNAEKKKDEEG